VPEGVGEGYVVFLSRVYPDITTSLASHPCLVRALRKACTVQAAPEASHKVLATKLRLKAEGILVTDAHVPVLSNYANALLRVYNLAADSANGRELEDIKSKDSRYQAKVANGPYPCEPGDKELLLASIASSLRMGEAEVQMFCNRLDACIDEQQLLNCTLSDESQEVPQWATWVPTSPVAM